MNCEFSLSDSTASSPSHTIGFRAAMDLSSASDPSTSKPTSAGAPIIFPLSRRLRIIRSLTFRALQLSRHPQTRVSGPQPNTPTSTLFSLSIPHHEAKTSGRRSEASWGQVARCAASGTDHKDARSRAGCFLTEVRFDADRCFAPRSSEKRDSRRRRLFGTPH